MGLRETALVIFQAPWLKFEIPFLKLGGQVFFARLESRPLLEEPRTPAHFIGGTYPVRRCELPSFDVHVK